MARAATPLLLHACCGPCSLEPLRLLREEGFEPTICWTNPNIQPVAEHDKRLRTLEAWARDVAQVEVIQAGDDRTQWERAVAPFGFDRPRRCRACYGVRLAEACRKEINTHFDTKLTIEKLAEKLGVSRNYLSTIFRAKTGYSINEYLNLTRLEEAKRLLRESSILIYEVAERSGFSDQYYFSKVFKAHVGVTPNEYRYNYQH